MINRATFVPEQFGQLTAIGWEVWGQFSARKVSLMVEKDTFGVCNDCGESMFPVFVYR